MPNPQSPIPKPQSPILPGATIGILGGGQLGRMLAMAAAELGYHAHIYCPEADCPASEVARETTVAAYEDTAALQKFAAGVDVITYEFENIPAAPLSVLGAKLHPGVGVLEICQHRAKEKVFVNTLGIGTAPFKAVQNEIALGRAAAEIGFPCIVKTSQLGYDGKGQVALRKPEDAAAAWASLKTQDAIVEGFVFFSMEISVIVARSAAGEMQCFPPVQNIHKNHILHQTVAPAPASDEICRNAETIACRIAEGLKLVGVLAVEMFVTKDNKILVNELAPRPHNSGHWTLDACVHSQFELAVRAVCGLPLVAPGVLCPAVMTNLIGDDINASAEWLGKPGARLHLYGKKEARPGRKMGHVTELGAGD